MDTRYVELRGTEWSIEFDFWDGKDIMDIPSGANHSLTLRQGRANYQEFGACEKEMLQHCRKPRKSEMK